MSARMYIHIYNTFRLSFIEIFVLFESVLYQKFHCIIIL